MTQERVYLRHASPNERRTISREHLGHYHAVIIGGVYRFGFPPSSSSNSFRPDSPSSFFPALKACIDEHPFLSAVIADTHTEKPFYQRVPTVNLAQHIHILPPPTSHVTDENSGTDNWTTLVESLLNSGLDRPFTEGIPPWRLVILPLPVTTASTSLSETTTKDTKRYFIAFEYSHGLGDGPSGLAFHRSFLAALRTATTAATAPQPSPSHPGLSSAAIIQPPKVPLPEPFDTPSRLPISWSFLLGPLLAAILPSFIRNLLGLKAQVAVVDESTWTGTPCFFDAEKGTQSRAVLITIPAEKVERCLKEARSRGAKMTGVMHQLVVRALSSALFSESSSTSDTRSEVQHSGNVKNNNTATQAAQHTTDTTGSTSKQNKKWTRLVSTTAINMRASCGVSPQEMGEFASGVYLSHPLAFPSPGEKLAEDEWASAREATRQLAEAAVRLQDQPIGLLRYVPNIGKWLTAKLGQKRDGSYEVSNLGNVDLSSGQRALIGGQPKGKDGNGTSTEETGEVEVENLVFAQPGHVTSNAVNFNVVLVKGGDLVVSITWPTGSLGLEGVEAAAGEEQVIRRVGEELKKGFELF